MTATPLCFVLGVSLFTPSWAGQPQEPILPPALPWDGASRSLVAAQDDPWITPCEESGLVATPRHAETLAWLERLALASDAIEVIELGRSAEGRPIAMVIASTEGAFDADKVRASQRPTVFAHAGIHAGEIDGKDAGMMLLRDLTVGGSKVELLDRLNFLFIPILNVDGHERFSAHGRINQRGPVEMGWRTNSNNLNLNRDFTKLDTAGVRAVVRVLTEYDPDLYVDLHVTDGIDYQYDITFGWVGPHGFSPSIANWLEGELRPALTRDLQAQGHIPGPLIFAVDNLDLSKGIVDWTGSPRFSNSYGDARHVPSVLVENHSLKPYDQRVLGTYVLLESMLRSVARAPDSLRRAIAQDRERRVERIPVGWRPGNQQESFELLGVAHEVFESELSGAKSVRWLGKPERMTVPYVRLNKPAAAVRRPAAYWVPAAWTEVIARLEAHGVRLDRIDEPREVGVTMDRIQSFELESAPFEGRMRMQVKTKLEQRTQRFEAGSVRVSTDQPLGDLAMLLLEPRSEDSFLQWGFFPTILQRTEYFEDYVMVSLAESMLAEDPPLRSEFEEKLARDEAFASDSRARLEWFYERSPWYDAQHLLYPVGREVE